MTLSKVCNLDELAEGEMLEAEVDGKRVIVLQLTGGETKAYSGLCPHESLPLAYGEFDGEELVCSAHHWTFDGRSGECIDPGGCRLENYAVHVKDGEVFVEV